MSVNRYDQVDAPEWCTSAFTMTPEGYLTGKACVTNIGVFPYRLADGNIQYELRHPDDVFEEESLDSYKLKPLTNNHPIEAVNSSNIKMYQVGNLGDRPYNQDNLHVTMDMTIQEKKTIDDILAGKRQLSCGYSLDIVDESGDWLGMHYDKRQKNIRINHVAIVDRARAGDAARIRFDSMDAELVTDTPSKIVTDATVVADNKKPNRGKKVAENMKTVKIDSVEYEAEAPVIVALNTANVRIDAMQTELTAITEAKSALEAERDSHKERADALDVKIAELEANRIDESLITERVAKRVELLGIAKDNGLEIKADASEMDIKKAVIMKVYTTANLDGKDDAYINARFDCACEEKASVGDQSVRKASTVGTAHVDGAENKESIAKAKYLERMAKGYNVKENK